MKVARENSIKKGEEIINQINSVIKAWEKYALDAAISSEKAIYIQKNQQPVAN